MASLIRTQLSDLCTRREVGTFGAETFGHEFKARNSRVKYETIRHIPIVEVNRVGLTMPIFFG